MKIALIGGHLTPALATIEYLQQHHPEHTLIFFGRFYSQERLKQQSHEAAEIAQKNIKFISYSAPRISQFFSTDTLTIPITFVQAVIHGLVNLTKEKPTVLVSFGGYLAVPLSVAAYILRIPIITHEQTRAVGFANMIIGKFAQRIAVSYPETQHFLPTHKTVVTGNPIRLTLFEKSEKPTWIGSYTKPLVYITGGNQGSEVINSTTKQALRVLTQQWTVIHQCGSPTRRRHYKSELEQARKKLPGLQQHNYIVREWVTEQELSWIYQHAYMVVSRAGANTVSELIAHKLPAILIPLPFARKDEQALNAEYMHSLGGADILHQKDLTVAKLLKTMQTVKRYHATMKQHLATLPSTKDAAKKLVQLITDVIE